MVKKNFFLVCLIFSAFTIVSAAPRTMRVDYFHTGNATTEYFSLERVSIEPLPWPGDMSKTIDDTNLGKYFFEVRDEKTRSVLYSRGFASIYGEWETTDEAKAIMRSFSESLRFPEPAAPVEIVLKKRDPQNAWIEIWTTRVDPKSIFIDRSRKRAPGRLIPIQHMGDSATKVDFVILGDGYTARELRKFEADARRLTKVLFTTSPFKEHKNDFNVWGLCPAAFESGISRPSSNIHRDSPIGSTYDAFGSERYVLTFDNQKLRNVAQFAPYEFIEILANNRTYGGGGIFNLYSTVAADNAFANYVFVHEFGHHFAALADEYYTSPVAYAPAPPGDRVEPWEVNVTSLLDPANLKWRDLVTPGTPLPTPWNKEEYEKASREYQKRRGLIRQEKRPESEMEALFNENLRFEQAMFRREKYWGQVGAFEGANYEAKGYYRPQIDCIMFSRTDYFCKVCKRGIEDVIKLYAR